MFSCMRVGQNWGQIGRISVQNLITVVANGQKDRVGNLKEFAAS